MAGDEQEVENQVQLTAEDESVSSGDLLMNEVTSDGESGEADADEAGSNGLEAVGQDLFDGAEGGKAAAESVPDLTGLLDVAFASDHSVSLGLESVVGTDQRVRISPANRFPWSTHCALLITARDNSRWIGTAFFVSPRVLVTAGHCVFIRSANPARHGWAKSIAVMPGRDGSNLPFGTHTSHRFYSVTGYTNSGSDEYDYGAIVLNSPVGLHTGRIGYGAYTDSTLTTSYGNISGYPGDRGGGSQQWYAARRIHSVSSRKLFYDTDTAGGQSGAAVYQISANGHRYAMGIHAYGVGGYPRNSATRITHAAFNNILAWTRAHT